MSVDTGRSTAAAEILMPRLSDSMEEGTIVRWLVDEGDRVVEGQPLVEVETDKASVTYESEHEGVLARIEAAVGASVAVGGVIAVVDTGGSAGAGSAGSAGAGSAGGVGAARPEAAQLEAGRGATQPGPQRVKASPLARRLAAELGVELADLAGSGPHGRVIRADVERAAGAGGVGRRAGNGAPATAETPAAPTVAAPAVAAPAVAAPAGGRATGEATREPLNRLQQTVARRMAEARATIPDFELRCEVDMSQVVDLRAQLRRVADPPPSYNDFVVKAAALALREFPRVNGSYRDGELELHGRVNVGIAVAAPDALLVPTIADADRRSLMEIAAAARELTERARAGWATPAELAGGTFTVSNLGMYGIDGFSPVINPPQGAILAVGSCRPRPVVDADGEIVARHTIELTLACDHRILYGADAARFLARLRELLENPLALIVG